MTRINADNLFGPTEYIVDTNPSKGSYSTIQSAIDALNAAGNFGTIIIRAGTYTENLAFVANQQIFGMADEGRVQNSSPVKIIGNHTFLGDGSPGNFGAMILQGIFFTSAAGNTFTVTSNGPNGIVFALKFCQVAASAGSAVTLNTVPGGSFALGVLFESNVTAAGSGFIINSDNCQIITYLSTIDAADTAIRMLGANSAFRDTKSEISGTANTISFSQASQSAFLDGTLLESTGSTITYGAAATTTALHCTHRSFDASGDYIAGLVGIYRYADDILTGTAINIAAGIAQSPFDWKPYGTTSTVGTLKANPADFTVSTAGEISLLSPVHFPWIDQGAPITVVPFTGYFFTAAITLTLPVAPAQGDEVKFCCDVGAACVVQASGAQTIRIGSNSSAAGGTATSTLIGDSLDLVFRAGSNEWISQANNGNWLLV